MASSELSCKNSKRRGHLQAYERARKPRASGRTTPTYPHHER
jgi:hypothetical protein